MPYGPTQGTRNRFLVLAPQSCGAVGVRTGDVLVKFHVCLKGHIAHPWGNLLCESTTLLQDSPHTNFPGALQPAPTRKRRISTLTTLHHVPVGKRGNRPVTRLLHSLRNRRVHTHVGGGLGGRGGCRSNNTRHAHQRESRMQSAIGQLSNIRGESAIHALRLCSINASFTIVSLSGPDGCRWQCGDKQQPSQQHKYSQARRWPACMPTRSPHGSGYFLNGDRQRISKTLPLRPTAAESPPLPPAAVRVDREPR